MEISENMKSEQDYYLLEAASEMSDEQSSSLCKDKKISKHSKGHSKTKAVELCTFYFKFGYCKFDKNCKFSHSLNGSLHSDDREGLFQSSEYQKNLQKNTKIEKFSEVENKQANRNMKTCRFFKAGFCSYGFSCSYDHNTEQSPRIKSAGASRKYNENRSRSFKQQSSSVCYFFARGFCRKNTDCKFFHPEPYSSKNSETISTASDKFVEQNNIVPQVKEVVNVEQKNEESETKKAEKGILSIEHSQAVKTVNMINIHELSSLSQDHICMLRNTEIKQMKRRFPNHKILEENKVYMFHFEPSDPDWPFDMKSLPIEVQLPEAYPIEVCKIAVLQKDENIPQLLIKHLNTSITEWLNKRRKDAAANGKVELIFRPFLKWFDRNLEELFICGLRQVKQDIKAKEAGIEYVPPEKLFSNQGCDASEFFTTEAGVQIDSNNILPPEPRVETKSCDISFKERNVYDDKVKHISTNECMKIILQNLELTEGAAALSLLKISVTLRCNRCKTCFNAKSEPKRNNSYKCLKCSKDIGFTLDPSTAHQFSNIIGNLYLMECLPVDINVQECQFLIDCLNCSKQVTAEGVHYGQKHKIWCRFCNQKLILSIENVKFQAAKLSSYTDVKYVPAKKIVKKTKDPVVKEGEPLPNFGTCKHYKKSYRWLRFPCCGRLYPCDVCHDEKENDHEMKFASRMICGFCSKEQPYSHDKPCFSCSKNVTKKSGCHWEGGKGCRNKIQMSREDKQKYAGTCKTVSKKAQSSKVGKKA